jgi:hypothetical protein
MVGVKSARDPCRANWCTGIGAANKCAKVRSQFVVVWTRFSLRTQRLTDRPSVRDTFDDRRFAMPASASYIAKRDAALEFI